MHVALFLHELPRQSSVSKKNKDTQTEGNTQLFYTTAKCYCPPLHPQNNPIVCQIQIMALNFFNNLLMVQFSPS